MVVPDQGVHRSVQVVVALVVFQVADSGNHLQPALPFAHDLDSVIATYEINIPARLTFNRFQFVSARVLRALGGQRGDRYYPEPNANADC